jgi:signal transduction histidine kinase/DNA-binding response OmpR family regulator/CHASE3 domain sensor protein
MKTTLKRNLLLGLSLSLVLLFISSLASYISIKNLIQSSEMVRHREDVIDKLNSVLSLMKDAETGQRGYLITGDASYLDPYNNAQGKTSELLNYISLKTSDDAFQQKNIKQLSGDITNRMRLLNLNLDQRRRHTTIDFDSLLKGKAYMDDIRVTIATMQKEEQRLLEIRTANLNQLASITPSIIILTALLAIGITLFFYKRVVTDFEEKTKLQQVLERKNEETERNINAMENVAAQISKGDYRIRMDKISQDTLGNLSISLNTMAESLQHAFTLLEEKDWLQTGIALLNDKMVGEKTVDLLARDIIENIAEYTGSQVAALYMFEEDKLLHLSGSYAMDAKEARDKLQPGEGISGQCLQSGKAILLEDIPANELTITYASGKTKPRNVVAVPVFKDKVVTGVVECGSLENYTPVKIEFLKSISENIGSALYAAQNRKRLQQLLSTTQMQSEELQIQHGELESMNAEMEAQTQKLQASEEELRVQQEELLQSNQELEERTSLLEEKNQLVLERNLEIQQKSEQIEQSSKYKSEFLANMSHELRTPLNSILLLSRLMSDSKELDKEYVEYADVIQSSGHGLLSLIDEILDLSKIEAGKMTLEPEDVTLQEISNDVRGLFMPLAKDKSLDLKINIADNTSPVLRTDKMRLEQILKNLLSNAFKFTLHGEVALNISNDDTGKKIILTVTDTGIGIPKDKQHLVFEAFQQADGSTRRKYGGTGLGLSISRELAKLLGGDIRLQSAEGKGSEFTLTLPVDIKDQTLPVNGRKEVMTETHKADVINLPGVEKPERFIVDHIPDRIKDDRDAISKDDKVILIVEDDTVFAGILLDYTRQKKYKGIVAVRGDEAVDMANHFKPEAILLDIQLPVMDGWQVMEELKSNPETRPIPVHIMSSLKVKKESLLRGAVDFINKPFALEQMQQIFQKLEDVLSKHPRKVLIVEENKQHANALSYYLSANNINTHIVNNVKESIDTLQKHLVDCVILDMGLPDKNAYETLEVIKQSQGLENLPIIVFTGKSLSIGEEARIKKYADSIVVKTAHSYQRILDEAGLFLHLVEEKKKKSNQAEPFNERLRELRDVLKDKTVLIADDDVRNIFSLTKALELHNMKVLPAIDGKESLKILKENSNVDVVLMDMMMPEMDGYETIREIRAMPAFKNTPVLAVTAKAMMGDREKCIAVGASDYISKPVDVDQLVSLLRVWLYDKQ